MSDSFLNTLEVDAAKSRETIQMLLDAQREDEPGKFEYKQFDRTWRRTDVIKLLNVSHAELISACDELDIKAIFKSNAYHYTIAQINDLRRHINEQEQPLTLPIVGILSGKGGSRKTTFSVYLAQALVLAGKRVLFIDTDPQASATTLMLGVNPDITFDVDDTIAPFLMGDEISLVGQVRNTGMPGLDIIPCCQTASVMDLQGVQGVSTTGSEIIDRFWALKETLELFREDYDVIVIDSPPTVTFTNIRTVIAANLIITPIAPSMTDVCSSTAYDNTLLDYFEQVLAEAGGKSIDLYARRFLITQYEHQKSPDRKFAEIIRHMYPSTYATPFANLSEVSNANENGTTVYEESSAIRSSGTRKKALTILNSLMNEVFEDIEEISSNLVPSHSGSIRDAVLSETVEAEVS